MYHNFKFVIILSLLVISCSQKKSYETEPFKKNDSPIALPSIEEFPVDKVEQYYEVKKGDTLYSIGLRLNLDYKKIAALNDIKAHQCSLINCTRGTNLATRELIKDCKDFPVIIAF